jgi:hypothetical protein
MDKELTSYQKLKKRVSDLEYEIREIALDTNEGKMYKLRYVIEANIEKQLLTGIGKD